jgi:hypothetical protein
VRSSRGPRTAAAEPIPACQAALFDALVVDRPRGPGHDTGNAASASNRVGFRPHGPAHDTSATEPGLMGRSVP